MARTPVPFASRVITEEEFEAWCEHPVTRFVAAAYQQAAEEQREGWLRASWDGGEADPKTLVMLKTRADAYRAFVETDWAHHAAMLQAEPAWWKFFQDRAREEARKRKEAARA